MPTGQYDRKPRGCYKLRPIFIPIGPSIAYVSLTRGQFALIDRRHAKEVGLHNWNASWSRYTKSFYAMRTINGTDGKDEGVLLHRQLLRLKKGDKTIGDHKNRNTLDCRHCNLRRANSVGSACNQGNRKNNTSGVKGVCWNRFVSNGGKWHATIQYRKKKMHIGLYDSFEEACKARREAALRLHGKFASEN